MSVQIPVLLSFSRTKKERTFSRVMLIDETIFTSVFNKILKDHLHSTAPFLFGVFGLEPTECKYHFYVILQKGYFKYRVTRAKRKKKAGIDPIRTAFDQMKV